METISFFFHFTIHKKWAFWPFGGLRPSAPSSCAILSLLCYLSIRNGFSAQIYSFMPYLSEYFPSIFQMKLFLSLSLLALVYGQKKYKSEKINYIYDKALQHIEDQQRMNRLEVRRCSLQNVQF